MDDKWLVLACEVQLEDVGDHIAEESASDFLGPKDESDVFSKEVKLGAHRLKVRDLVGKTFDVVGERWLNADFEIEAATEEAAHGNTKTRAKVTFRVPGQA